MIRTCKTDGCKTKFKIKRGGNQRYCAEHTPYKRRLKANLDSNGKPKPVIRTCKTDGCKIKFKAVGYRLYCAEHTVVRTTTHNTFNELMASGLI